jgi:biopolymer transport protein ExbD
MTTMKITRQRRPQLRMEMSPLIDCVFLLLIFFMLSSTFLTPAIKLSLPTAAAGTNDAQEILVTLDVDGQVFLNKQLTSFSELGPELQKLLAGSDARVVTIRGDEAMTYDNFVRALDIAKKSGAEHVNIAHSTP